MTAKQQAEAIADWVECCARLQQFGEGFIESGPFHDTPKILLVSVAAMFVARTMPDTSNAAFSHQTAVLNRALAITLSKTLDELTTL